ncbi:MAG: dihydrofolate reductase [Muribaculaceae bacterium]|nr:dihydrofolate reductase [Muribaculaceae bacterium]
MITIIAAVTSTGAIGRRGDLICHIPGDLRHFKELTMGHPIIMGRKTFESLPGGALPGRRNIVITTRRDFRAPGVETVGSLAEAICVAGEADCYIIGGRRVYAEAMPIADALSLTEIDIDGPEDADTFFPEVDPSQWRMTARSETLTDPRTSVTYRFTDYTRRP